MPRPVNYINKIKKYVDQMDKSLLIIKGIISAYDKVESKPVAKVAKQVKTAKKKVGKK